MKIGEAVPQHGNGFGVGKSDHQGTEIADRTTIASSPESSSSGDNHHANRPNQTRESNSSRMVVDDECSFWDLDGFWDPVN